MNEREIQETLRKLRDDLIDLNRSMDRVKIVGIPPGSAEEILSLVKPIGRQLKDLTRMAKTSIESKITYEKVVNERSVRPNGGTPYGLHNQKFNGELVPGFDIVSKGEVQFFITLMKATRWDNASIWMYQLIDGQISKRIACFSDQNTRLAYSRSDEDIEVHPSLKTLEEGILRTLKTALFKTKMKEAG